MERRKLARSDVRFNRSQLANHLGLLLHTSVEVSTFSFFKSNNLCLEMQLLLRFLHLLLSHNFYVQFYFVIPISVFEFVSSLIVITSRVKCFFSPTFNTFDKIKIYLVLYAKKYLILHKNPQASSEAVENTYRIIKKYDACSKIKFPQKFGLVIPRRYVKVAQSGKSYNPPLAGKLY